MAMKIGVPDAERAFVLAGRLGRYGAEVRPGDDAPYEVTLDEPPADELAAVFEMIDRWVHDEHVDHPHVEVDGRPNGRADGSAAGGG